MLAGQRLLLTFGSAKYVCSRNKKVKIRITPTLQLTAFGLSRVDFQTYRLYGEARLSIPTFLQYNSIG
jgi:hypothetical protein